MGQKIEKSVARTEQLFGSSLASLTRPNWLPEDVWPFQTSALEIEGCNIGVTDVGVGPVLVFVHTGFWSFLWRDVMLRLTGEFRCVAFDAPGTGQSERVPLRALTLHRASRVLVGVIRSLDLRDLTLVCHDLGGLSGIVGAVEVADRVRGLCAVNTFAWPPAGRFLRGMLTLMGNSVVRELDAVTGLLPQITASKFGVGLHLDDPSRNAFLAGIGRQGVRSFHDYMRDARYSSTGEEAEVALRGPLRRVAVMTVFGERNDPFGFQRRWRQLFPNCRQVVIPGGNHFPMCDAPDLLADSIREHYRTRIAPSSHRPDE